MKIKLYNQYLIYLLIILQMGCSSEEFGGIVVYEINSSVSPIEGGSISPSTGNFDPGDKVTIKAIAAEGYLFKNWAGDISGSNNPYTLTINSNTTIIAIFEKKDSDKDGITDDKDECPNTPMGELVNTSGCSESQLDSDGDGVNDDIDECPETEDGQNVNEKGCSPSETDSDGDGVFDDLDECPETVAGENVDGQGCSTSQTDSDGDGVYDDLDFCPDTSPELSVDENGCAPNQKDSDNDGVSDDLDQCPNTLSDAEVDQFGCSEGETDGDNDGVINADDTCPNTPTGESVNEEGCSISQIDSDNDGVTDNIDLCPNTPSGESVDNSGCSDSQKDSDNDGVTDDNDQCPETPFDQLVDDNGCSVGQNDSDGDGIFDDVDDCPNTNPNDTADSNGCSEAQKDTDGDGVTNDIDQCPNTPSNEDTDENGCSDSQKDSDGDGIADINDNCPSTPSGENVDSNGCSDSQNDSDNDGIPNGVDQCPETPSGDTVNEDGCTLSYIPDDGFEQQLINLGYDDVLDDYVVTSNIDNVLDLELSSLSINDYTGLKDFTSLKSLNTSGTSGTRTLDISGMNSLESVYTGMYGPSRIILGQNSNLKTLICDNNDDVILPDFNQAPALEYVNYKYTNASGTMDLSQNPNLINVIMHNTNISGLNLKNGNNQNLSVGLLEVYNLKCITVDDPVYSRANWTENVDPYIDFLNDCNSPQIGDFYQGGIIFYISQPGDPDYIEDEVHGKIVSENDVATIVWSLTPLNVNTSNSYSGQANTLLIIETQGESGNYAASYCNDLILQGYDDWYLPSMSEFGWMYANIGFGATGSNLNIGGFSRSAYYWSSQQWSSGVDFAGDVTVALFDIPNGSDFDFHASLNLVRAVRDF